MKYLFILVLFLFSCTAKQEMTGNYYPGSYQAQFNIGNQSTLSVSETSLVAGESAVVTATTFDNNGVRVNKGGAEVSFLSVGAGSVVFSSVTDNGNGTYSSTFTAQKSGEVRIGLAIKNKTLSSRSEIITITPGAINKDRTDFFLTQTHYWPGEDSTFYVTPKDSFGNTVNNPNLNLTANLVDGTSQGSFSGFTYNPDGTYTTTFTASDEEGTVSTINVFIQGVGVSVSPYTVTIAFANRPDYFFSNINPVSTLRVGQSRTVTINIKINEESIDQDLIPVVFNVTGVTGTFTRAVHVGSTYQSTFTPTSVGTATISAEVDGFEIQEGINVEVTL